MRFAQLDVRIAARRRIYCLIGTGKLCGLTAKA
jgi:hypothetical protein